MDCLLRKITVIMRRSKKTRTRVLTTLAPSLYMYPANVESPSLVDPPQQYIMIRMIANIFRLVLHAMMAPLMELIPHWSFKLAVMLTQKE